MFLFKTWQPQVKLPTRRNLLRSSSSERAGTSESLHRGVRVVVEGRVGGVYLTCMMCHAMQVPVDMLVR
jgi:hypothetical protein